MEDAICECPEDAYYGCPVCDPQPKYCLVCDGGHDGGEFGELCPANGPRWFEPSDPRDLGDEPQVTMTTTEVWW